MGLIFMKLLFCTLGLSFIRGALTTHMEVVNDCIKMYVCMSCLLSVVLCQGLAKGYPVCLGETLRAI